MIYHNLKVEMVRKRITNADVAKHLNLTQQSIYAKFTGRQTITLEDAHKIKQLLNSDLSIDYLFIKSKKMKKTSNFKKKKKLTKKEKHHLNSFAKSLAPLALQELGFKQNEEADDDNSGND